MISDTKIITEVKVSHCRLCRSELPPPLMHLGNLAHTGIFPDEAEPTPYGLIELALCNSCRLVQTTRNYDRAMMYGENYGYRSGLNNSMVAHLEDKIQGLLKKYNIDEGSTILDIGSNDGTLLNHVPETYRRVGVDPTIPKFEKYYNPTIKKIASFFDETTIDFKAELITTISMFYDLPNPKSFIDNLVSALEPTRGVWHMEQAYWPQTVRTLGYDTICHEHLEYYSLSTIVWIAKAFKLKIIDIGFNDINGGSFFVDLSPRESIHTEYDNALLHWMLSQEMEFLRQDTLNEFQENMLNHASSLKKLLVSLRSEGHSVVALGASTKGNVLLQVANITPELVSVIGEINSYKFDKFTPGTGIKIRPQNEVLGGDPDFILILPWHFAAGIIQQIRQVSPKSKIIIPLPYLRIV